MGVVRFRIHKDLARTKGIVWPRFSHPGFFAKPEHGLPGNFIATMGMPVTAEGRQEDGELTLAARNAVIRMIELLEERGWSRELPEDIFVLRYAGAAAGAWRTGASRIGRLTSAAAADSAMSAYHIH